MRQPALWEAALRATADPTKWSLFGRKAACDSFCAARPGWRSWAIDLGRKPGGTGHPKSFIAAEPGVFFAAYARFAPQQRHAYEIVQGPCNLFFDRAASRGHLSEAARKAACRPRIRTDARQVHRFEKRQGVRRSDARGEGQAHEDDEA